MAKPADPDPALPRGPVEARSLSAITSIASHPPAYPRNPAQQKLEPLALYIVRVPGSKDVFLSPLKPPTKASVSAEAINSSLYYLHVATPDDDVLLKEFVQEREEEAMLKKERGEEDEEKEVPREFAKMNQVKRKPVQKKPVGGPGEEEQEENKPPLHAHAHAHELPLQQQHQRRPLPLRTTFTENYYADGPATQPHPAHSPYAQPQPQPQPADSLYPRSPITRRPLPPVPSEPEVPQRRFSAKMANRWSALSDLGSRGLENWKEKYDALAAGRPSSGQGQAGQFRPHSAHGSPSRSGRGSPAHSPPYDHRPSPPPPSRQGFHITLIRRDPTHGTQWNVATISTPHVDGTGIDIEVSTPGYNRFTGQNEPISLESMGLNLSDLTSNGGSSSHALAALSSKQPPAPQLKRFTRQLCVSRPYYQDDYPRGSLDTPRNRASIESSNGGGSSHSHSHSHSHSKLKSGYYTFTSPWNGTCTFSTSVNGRTLKCKHMIPMPGLSEDGPENPAVTVAEIRFNTPFQTGHLHHQPGPTHVSPFSLSQTPTFGGDPGSFEGGPSSLTPSTTAPPTTPSYTSKRASFAQLLNPNTYSNRPRSRSNTSNPDSLGPPQHPASVPRDRTRYPRPPSTSSTDSGSAHAHDGLVDSHHPPPPPPPPHAVGGPPPLPQRPGQEPAPLRRQPSEERLDFSLARENAGGGMRGKSAKLGKLVIEDEGIKMLDLVVAACMGVWWRGYYY